MHVSCTFQYIVWLERPSSTLYGLEEEEMAERADCSWCSSWRRFHGSPDGDANTQSDGYREHYASMADVITIFAFAAVNASRDDMQTVILCLSSLPAAAAATTLL